MSDVGAVILHWRHWPEVRHAIDALLAEGVDPVNVRIVDNASGDGSVEQIRHAYPQGPEVLARPSNGGYAAGMNAGIRALGDRDVLLLTHETILLPGCIAALQARLEAEPGLGVVGPMLALKDDPQTVFSEGGRFNRRMAISHRSDGEPVADHRDDGPQPADWVDGSCLLIRREVFDTVGYFDEGYFLYYEETDFMARAGRLGWTIECVPSARALQQPGPRPIALWTRNRLRFLRRNASFGTFMRQALVDLRAVAMGPDRGLTALGLGGFLVHADPAALHRRSNRGTAAPSDASGAQHSDR
jgi:GT2 family glycosyltransferase